MQISLLCFLIFFMSVELGNQLLPYCPLFKRVILKYLQDNLFLSIEVMVDYCQQYAKVFTINNPGLLW